MSESFKSQKSQSPGCHKSMKAIASFTKEEENDTENTRTCCSNIQIHLDIICCIQHQTSCLSAAQCTHQLLFFIALEWQQYDMAEPRVNSSANFSTNPEIYAQHYVLCYVCCIFKAHFKAHFSVKNLYYFMF